MSFLYQGDANLAFTLQGENAVTSNDFISHIKDFWWLVYVSLSKLYPYKIPNAIILLKNQKVIWWENWENKDAVMKYLDLVGVKTNAR